MTSSPDDLIAAATAAARASADPGLDDGAATRLRLRTSLASRARPRSRSRRRLTLIAAIFGTFIGSTAFALAVHSGWTPPWRSSPAPIEAPPPPAPPTSLAAIAPPRGRVVLDTPADPPAPSAAAIDAEQLADATPTTGASMASPTAPGSSVPGSSAPGSSVPGSSLPPRPPMPARVAAGPTTPALPTRPAPTTAPPATPGPTTPPPMTPPTSSSPSTATPGPTAPATGTGAPRIATTAAPSAANDVAGGSSIDDELAAYRVAHTAHFRGTDPVAALAAWDRYLARFPNGRLAPDARYDRALVLVKLQRWADARDALRPFAATTGGYRQHEAAELMAAIANR
jgi:TolA-binding protein